MSRQNISKTSGHSVMNQPRCPCRSVDHSKSLLRFIPTRSILSHYVIYNFGRSLSTNLCRPYISPHYNNRLRPPHAPPRSQGDTLDPLKMYANERAYILVERKPTESLYQKVTYLWSTEKRHIVTRRFMTRTNSRDDEPGEIEA